VRQALGQDPLSGALYLFTNRRRTTAKVLQFDGTGLALYIKRLARGRFAALWETGGDGEPVAVAAGARAVPAGQSARRHDDAVTVRR
jgi:transposase